MRSHRAPKSHEFKLRYQRVHLGSRASLDRSDVHLRVQYTGRPCELEIIISMAGPVAVWTFVNVFRRVDEVDFTVEVVIMWGVDAVDVVVGRSGVAAEEKASAFWYWRSAMIANSETARVMMNSAASRTTRTSSTQTLQRTRPDRLSIASVRDSGLTYTQLSGGELSDCMSGDSFPWPIASWVFMSVI